MEKPSEFYVGVLDIFGVLLPGAIATALLEPHLGNSVLGPLISRPSSQPAVWATFLVIAYFLGHLIFLLGAYLDPLYDKLRGYLNPDNETSAYKVATSIRDSLLTKTEQVPQINTFQWARSVLLTKCPAAAQDVHRLEADSKFFRSMIIVSTLASALFFLNGRLAEGGFSLVVIAACFARYYERRSKSTKQAYIHVVTLHCTDGIRPVQKNDSKSNA